MGNLRHILLLSASLALIPAVANAASKTGDCPSVKLAVTASDLIGSTTNSTSAVNVPEAAAAFNQKGNKPACIVVEFLANTFEAPGEQLIVGALLDGVLMFPSTLVFSSDSDENGNGNGTATHAFAWMAVAAPGAHMVQIQYASNGGTPVLINKHTTLVHHR